MYRSRVTRPTDTSRHEKFNIEHFVVVYHVTIVAIGHMLNKGFERPLSSKQEMEIRLEPESNLVRCTGEPGLPGCNYFCQVVDDVRGG